MMCQYDEGFTINEMLEETTQCKNCTLDCQNKSKVCKSDDGKQRLERGDLYARQKEM